MTKSHIEKFILGSDMLLKGLDQKRVLQQEDLDKICFHAEEFFNLSQELLVSDNVSLENVDRLIKINTSIRKKVSQKSKKKKLTGIKSADQKFKKAEENLHNISKSVESTNPLIGLHRTDTASQHQNSEGYYNSLTSKNGKEILKEILEREGKEAIVSFFAAKQFYVEVRRIIELAKEDRAEAKQSVNNFVNNLSQFVKDDQIFDAFSEARSSSKWTRWAVSDAFNSKKMYGSDLVDKALPVFISPKGIGGALKMLSGGMKSEDPKQLRTSLREDFEHAKSVENPLPLAQLNQSQVEAYSNLIQFLSTGDKSKWTNFNSFVKDSGTEAAAGIFRTREIRQAFESTFMQGNEGIDRVINVLVSKEGRSIMSDVLRTPEGINLVGYLWNTPEGKTFVSRMLSGKNMVAGIQTAMMIVNAQRSFKGEINTTPIEEL